MLFGIEFKSKWENCYKMRYVTSCMGESGIDCNHPSSLEIRSIMS